MFEGEDYDIGQRSSMNEREIEKRDAINTKASFELWK